MAMKGVRTVATGPEKAKVRVKDAAESNTRRERRRGEEKTPFENFEGLTSKLLKVPKEEVDEARKRK